MKVIDNSPIFEPAEGRLAVETSTAAEVLVANHYYVTDDCDAELQPFMCLDCLRESIDMFVLEKNGAMPDISRLHNLKNAIEDERANLVLPLDTPGRKERYFIVARVETKDDVARVVALMAYSAERITNHCLKEAVKGYAIDDVDDFLSRTHDLFSTGRFVRDYLANLGAQVFSPVSFGIAPSHSYLMTTLNIDGFVTHRERLKMLDNMDKYLKENISKFKKKARTDAERAERRKAEAEIDMLCSNIDPETLKRLFNMLTPSQRERAVKLLDPREVAKNSEMFLSVERNDVNYVNSKTTDGYYVLYFKKDDRRMLVHFGRRASSALYLIYLIDRYRKPEVDTLNLRNYQEQYVNLYEKLYHNKSEGEVKFKELWQKYDKHPQIHLCLNDIRQTIYAACREMDEIASPYMLETEFSHLFVDSGKIQIPQELVALMK